MLAGCSDPRGKRVTVTGKVTLDGQPLTGGAVYFHPIHDKDAPPLPEPPAPSVSELGDDGSYTLRTQGKAGAPLGKYRVQLEPGDKSDLKLWSQLPRQYTMRNSSLLVEVVENKPEAGYDLQLSSKDRQDPKSQKGTGIREKMDRWSKFNKRKQ
jgi:hypothetical protein